MTRSEILDLPLLDEVVADGSTVVEGFTVHNDPETGRRYKLFSDSDQYRVAEPPADHAVMWRLSAPQPLVKEGVEKELLRQKLFAFAGSAPSGYPGAAANICWCRTPPQASAAHDDRCSAVQLAVSNGDGLTTVAKLRQLRRALRMFEAIQGSGG